MRTRTCPDCGAQYQTIGHGGFDGRCVNCAKRRTKNRMDPYQKKRHENKKDWYWRNHEVCLNRQKKHRLANRERTLYVKARHRALRRGLDFDIEVSDIVIPEFCPVLGIKLILDSTKQIDASPTIDRIITSLGYVKGNVRVISWRANRLKADSTAEDLRALYLDSLTYADKEANLGRVA